MNNNLFRGPKLKLARADAHVRELATKMTAYLARDPFAGLVVFNKNTGKRNVLWKGREEIPDELPIIFGDAVHNMRAALDLLANDLVALSGKPPKKVYFPFGMGPQHFEEQLAEKMNGASVDILDIVRNFKPWPAVQGGNEAMRAIHDLDIQDKHVRIMNAYAQASLKAPLKQVDSGNPKILRFVDDMERIPTVKFDATGYKFEPDQELIGKVADAPFDLVIAPSLPLEGYPVLAALDEMLNIARGVVERFETHCLGGK